MKRIMMSGLGVAFLAGVVGCGNAGMEGGAPSDLTPSVPIDPNMTKMGMMGTGAAKAAAAKTEQAKSAPTGETPAEPKP